MDSLIAAAARALAAGDPLGALKHVACATTRRRSRCAASPWPSSATIRAPASCCGAPPAAFGAREALARARCVVAEAEVALAMRDLGGSPRALAPRRPRSRPRAITPTPCRRTLIAVRRLLLLGRSTRRQPSWPTSTRAACHRHCWRCRVGHGRAGAALAAHGIGARRRSAARTTRPNARAYPRSGRGGGGARRARAPGGPASSRGPRAAAAPRRGRSAARLRRAGGRRLPSRPARRRGLAAAGAPAGAVRAGAYAGRGVARRCRPARADRARVSHAPPDESHRARLRVEIGRLRALAAPLARIEASARGFALTSQRKPRGRPRATHRRRSGVAARAARRRRGLVHVGPRAGPRGQPAHGPARARRARSRRTGALDRAGARASAGYRRRWRIHDDLVTPAALPSG
jgi:hypothetical protein